MEIAGDLWALLERSGHPLTRPVTATPRPNDSHVGPGIPDALQGICGFIPILTTYDLETSEGRIFFYDGMGARFESAEFGAAGSGSMQIRGVFDYIVKTKKPFHDMSREEALKEALY